jgi:drug/metabolite transporter (DMT)-like permease
MGDFASTHVGEGAAILCALLWSVSLVAWSHAGARAGAITVAVLRTALATAVLAAAHWAFYGSPWPLRVPARSMLCLAASGLVSAGIGDILSIRSLALIGPRIPSVIMTLSPAIAVILAWWGPLGERLNAAALAGIALTTAGVVGVTLERPAGPTWRTPPGQFWPGVFCAAAATGCFGAGYVLSRMGLSGEGAAIPPFSANLVRIATALLVCLAALPFYRRSATFRTTLRDRRTMRIILTGTAFGPIIGMYFSMIALQRAPAGVATALINLLSIFILPLVYISHRERPSPRAILGAVVAAGGVALLAMRDRF